jgi:hypothetical protein
MLHIKKYAEVDAEGDYQGYYLFRGHSCISPLPQITLCEIFHGQYHDRTQPTLLFQLAILPVAAARLLLFLLLTMEPKTAMKILALRLNLSMYSLAIDSATKRDSSK